MADEPGIAPSSDPARRSRLGSPRFLVHADLHNHTLFSDGRGDPVAAFEQLKAAGLDVAALTDHASIPFSALPTLDVHEYPDDEALVLAYSPPRSIDSAGWLATAALADAHDEPGVFTAIRGFEWTEPWLGHVNVWFSGGWTPVTTPGSIAGLHSWLASAEPDALFGYNHPGREPGRLGGFALPASAGLAASLVPRMVAVEAFNRREDFLFARSGRHGSSLAAVLDAGWRPGLIGCSDEHGRSFGLAGKGRTGLWVHELSRAGVAEALRARATFATREVGLRLDATLDGVPMGSALGGPLGGRHELRVDLGWNPGAPVLLQVLTTDEIRAGGVRVAAQVRLDAGHDGLIAASVDLPAASWVVLRVADPARPNEQPGPPGHPADRWALAYASPWWAG